MPTKKDDSTKTAQEILSAEAYDAALAKYASGVELIGKKDFSGAHVLFEQVATAGLPEPELTQRARGYAVVCERQPAPPLPEPQTGDECYARAVFLSNAGQWDDALRLLDQAIIEKPSCVRSLYARACAWALKGATDKAVNDLRQAIAGDPTIRFQAVNDPDFERIREEPAFIDIIEPTPTGS